ncbi:pyruvate kinase [Psychrosphaera ytuae]|uniref:Pyruvate kinase n=1 Tax=Psychrosphaera ytuae TaxID=2820710 RepID=A0A975DEY0_9GAMM|nr:pyruvate kinase [Psychrosphaera ytuae]QTH64390.1 pyruvate kinase [Psychrosphaera ytuae]
MTNALRRTKIVSTLGPATDRDGILEQIITAGVNTVRMNFSHGTAQDHIDRAKRVREVAKKLNTYVAILGDLQGPKIRVARFRDGKIHLSVGDKFVLDAQLDKDAGDQQQVGIDYKDLPNDVTPGDILLLDDGRVQLKVESVEGSKVFTEVTVAGPLSNNKGINRKGGGLTAPALTDKDKADIKTAAEIGVEYLAVSFPRNGADIEYARKLAKEAGFNPRIVAKVERAETVATDEAIDDIILASDVIMVARGDLGVEIGDAELVGVQKKLIARSRQLNKAVITATQMMESMISNPMPTRAEVMDVSNAVLDGTDAVMLSAETAAGDFPVETVKAMASVCLGAEKHPSVLSSKHRLDVQFDNISETVAMATMYAANHLKGIKAIVALTESGGMARLLSRISSGLPIYALSRHEKTLNRCALLRGVYPCAFDSTEFDQEDAREAVNALVVAGRLQKGDLVMLTHGDKMETVGATNTMKIMTA